MPTTRTGWRCTTPRTSGRPSSWVSRTGSSTTWWTSRPGRPLRRRAIRDRPPTARQESLGPSRGPAAPAFWRATAVAPDLAGQLEVATGSVVQEGRPMDQDWRKSSSSKGACAEAAVLDLTVRDGRVVRFDPVRHADVGETGTARSAEVRDAVARTPTTPFDAWNTFAAQHPRSASDLLAATRRKVSRLEGAGTADQGWDEAIKV